MEGCFFGGGFGGRGGGGDCGSLMFLLSVLLININIKK